MLKVVMLFIAFMSHIWNYYLICSNMNSVRLKNGLQVYFVPSRECSTCYQTTAEVKKRQQYNVDYVKYEFIIKNPKNPSSSMWFICLKKFANLLMGYTIISLKCTRFNNSKDVTYFQDLTKSTWRQTTYYIRGYNFADSKSIY